MPSFWGISVWLLNSSAIVCEYLLPSWLALAEFPEGSLAWAVSQKGLPDFESGRQIRHESPDTSMGDASRRLLVRGEARDEIIDAALTYSYTAVNDGRPALLV